MLENLPDLPDLFPMLKVGAEYLGDKAVSEGLKESIKLVFEKIKSKFQGKSGKDKVDAVVSNPTDENCKKLEDKIHDALKDDEIQISELKEHFNELKLIIEKITPSVNNSNRAHISHSKNVIVGSTIKAGGNVIVGDNNTTGSPK